MPILLPHLSTSLSYTAEDNFFDHTGNTRRMKQKEDCAKTSTGTKPPYTEILKASVGSKDRLTT